MMQKGESISRITLWEALRAAMLPFACWAMLAADYLLHEVYVRTNSALLWATLMLGVGVANVFVVLAFAWVGRGKCYRAVSDLLAAIAVAAVGWMWLKAVLPAEWLRVPVVLHSLFAAVALLYLMCAWLLRASLRMRLDGSIIAIMLASPLIGYGLGVVSALSVDWPAGGRDVHERMLPQNVIYLLLDELGAEASMPLVALLEAQGWNVSFRPVRAVGDMTLKVVPQMFSGVEFSQARPCGATIICDSKYSLDFSKVRVTRPDIDIVGFYHPYCAMKGLRSCVRVTPASEVFSAKRWICAARRYVSRGLGDQPEECASLPLERWGGVVDRAEATVKKVRFWREGGMLFAHLPMPHPPGRGVGSSLAVHYSENLERVRALLTWVSAEAREQFGDQVAIVIFSDHGLRYQQVCASTIYAATPCDIPVEYQDRMVPLIVATGGSVDLHSIDNNGQVFLLQ